MSGGKLVVKQALGLSGNVKNCLTFVEEHHLAYVCGHQVVVMNTETKEQNFISGTSSYQHQSLGFTAIACCPSKKVIAIAEKVEPTAIVTFYDAHTLRKKKLLTSPEIGSNEIRSLAFSEDGKYLVTQGAGPEWNLALWLVDKAAKVLCTTKISLTDDNPVHKVSFCPWDNNVILVIGKTILKFFRFVEGQLRPIAITVRRDNANFISYCWVNEEHLIVGTESGELFLIENFEIRGYINPNKNDQDELYPILCLQTTSRGFIMGTFHGEIKLFERHDDVKEKYLLEDSYIIPGDHGHILEFALGVDELLICALSKHQLMSGSMSSLYNINKDAHHNAHMFDHVFAYFHSPNHKGDCEITGIDIALWKQIVVTTSKDNTVRVWNPIDKKIELMKEFDEEPLGISVHPTGIYIAVMFSDKIKILSLLLEEIHLSREILARQITYIKFSRGGQYLAAAIGTNLHIYQTYTGLQVATLRGHNNRIKSVVWMNYDSRIVTFGVEGVVHSWDLFPLNKRPEHFVGTVPILSGTCPLDGTSVYIATNDLAVKEITFSKQQADANAVAANAAAGGGNNLAATTTNPGLVSERVGTSTTMNATTSLVPGDPTGAAAVVRINKTLELPMSVSTMYFEENRRMLIMGTNHDTMPCSIVVTLTSPALGGSVSNTTPPIMDYNIIHAAPVTALCVSPDGMTVYSGDAAGCIFISEFESLAMSSTSGHAGGINNLLKSPVKSQREGFVSFEFVDEVIIHKSDLESRKSQILQLTNTVEELNKNNDHQLRLKDFEFKDKLKEITDKYSVQLKQERNKYEELETEKSNLEREFQKKVKVLEEKHQEELVNMDKKYKLKYNAEENRHKLLLEETRDATKRWNEENEVLIQSHQKFLEEVTNDYESKLLFEQKLQQEIRSEKENMQVSYDTMKNDTENDGDREIAEMKIRYDSKLKQEEETAQQLITQHASMSKQYESLVKESSQQKIEIKRLKDKESRLYETIHTLEKDIQSHKKEIREREETITDKEKRIFDLKKKNQELEKFRFVLDYKIKELKLQIAPRENEINTMRKQIEEMNLELEQYQKSNLSLNLMIDELKLKMDGIKHELSLQDDRVVVNERFLEKFRGDLQDLWIHKQDMNTFKNKLIRMYRIYVQEELNASTLGGGSGKKTGGKSGKNESRRDLDDPQQIYNRDREQLERSLDSLRRAMKTENLAHKRDLGKMMREGVMLTKELNTLRKNARALIIQKKAIENAGDLSNMQVLQDLMELLGLSMAKKSSGERTKPGIAQSTGHSHHHAGDDTMLHPQPPTATTTAANVLNPKKRNQLPARSAALRTTSADGIVNRTTLTGSPDGKDTAALKAVSGRTATSRQDQWEAWREIQIQYDQMKTLEDQITVLCQGIGLDPIPVIVSIDTQLDY